MAPFAAVLVLCFASCAFGALLLRDHDIWGDGNFVNGTRDPRVLNFFPVPVDLECLSTDRRRKGACLNTYECKIQGGRSHGPCALGFGVCCVFTATCSEEVINNITYFVNPDFPDLSKGMTSCELTVKKVDPEVAQLRLDFVHFTLGQPNRRTGVCEDDVFVLSGGDSKDLRLCGLNSGQHVYYDVQNANDSIKISMNLSKKTASRLWEVRILQVPFTQEAPSGCLQYHTGSKGMVATMNFADNGRHLADQDYTICIRQEEEMCAIVYEPCDENSFRIGPNSDGEIPSDDADGGSGDGGVEGRDMMEVCVDGISIPCASDDLLMMGEAVPGYCTATHCGDSLCPEDVSPCRIESTATPFTIGVHFSPATREQSPDDNLGMCLLYEQQPCKV